MPRRLDRETRRPGPGVAIAVLALCALVVGYVGMVALRDVVPLYARVVLGRDADGGLKLMELEMVEPYLYPLQGPELGPRMAAATRRRLG